MARQAVRKEKKGTPSLPAHTIADLFTFLDPTSLERPTKVMALPIPRPFIAPPRPRKSKHDGGHCALTTAVANKLLSVKRAGFSDKTAAEFAGIGPTMLSQWVNNHNNAYATEPYHSFRVAWQAAKLYPKMFLLDAVFANAYADGKLALDLLARLEPETYAKVIVIQASGKFHHSSDLGQLLQDAAEQRRVNGAPKEVGSGSTALVDPRGPRPNKE